MRFSWSYAFIVGFILACGLIAGLYHARHNPTRIWRQLESGRPGAVARLWSDLGIESELCLTNSDQHIHVEMIPAWRISGNQHAVILCLTDGCNWDWQYLIFVRKWGLWRFVGKVDLPCQKYAKPVPMFVAVSPDDACMVIRELSCSGTGVLLYEEVWYAWTQGRIKEVLRFPFEGHVAGWGLSFDRKFMGTVARVGLKTGEVFSVAVDIHEEFFPEDHLDEKGCVFSEDHQVVFRWSPAQCRFILDTNVSEMTEAELQGVWEDGTPEFLSRHSKILKELQISGSPDTKQWVRIIQKKAVKSNGAVNRK